MARMYRVLVEAVTISNTNAVIQLKAGANCVCVIHQVTASQSTNTTSAQLRIEILRYTTACTVTSYTPLQYDSGDGAAKSVGGTSATGTASSADGTAGDVLKAEAFNALTTFVYYPSEPMRPRVSGGGFFGVRFAAAPSLAMTVELVFEEVGG